MAGYFVSLFYNIPVASIGQELKLYDLIMPFFIFHFLSNRQGVIDFARNDKVSWSMIKFAAWCSLTFVITCIVYLADGNVMWLLQAAYYLFHLWGFVLCTVFIRKDFLLDRRYFERAITLILILGVLETLVIMGQNFDFIPYLWSEEYFIAYGDTSLSGTLGPNRVVPGSTMFLLFVLGICIVTSKQSLRINRLLGVTLAITSILVIGLSGSRTAYLSVGAFLGVLAVVNPRTIIRMAIPIVIVVGMAMVIFDVRPMVNKVEYMLNYRIFDQLEMVESVGNRDYFDELGAGRKGKIYKSTNFLLNNPVVIPFGRGFLNMKGVKGLAGIKEGNSSHNLYLQMIIENGVVGLYLYLAFIFAFIGNNRRDRNSYILIAMILAVLVNLFFGENFYVYRTSYGLLGLLLLTATIIDYRRVSTPFLEKEGE
jgi:hypothetical protein